MTPINIFLGFYVKGHNGQQDCENMITTINLKETQIKTYIKCRHILLSQLLPDIEAVMHIDESVDNMNP